MGFKATVASDESHVPDTAVETPDFPPATPPEPRDEDDIRTLVSSSDKELRIMFAGLYQAVLQSQALYAARNIMDISTWHQAVDEEVDYYARRVLERARKE